MIPFIAGARAAVLVPLLLGNPAAPTCHRDRLTYVSPDDRAVARFTAATHDYVAYGKEGAVFDAEMADILRFRLRVTRWLHRYDTFEALSDDVPPVHGTFHHSPLLGALPQLPDELEYRLSGRHLLLVDRRTRAVVDLLPDAFGSRSAH